MRIWELLPGRGVYFGNSQLHNVRYLVLGHNPSNLLAETYHILKAGML